MDDESSLPQPVDWELLYRHGEPVLFGRWPTNISHRGIRSVPFRSSRSSTHNNHNPHHHKDHKHQHHHQQPQQQQQQQQQPQQHPKCTFSLSPGAASTAATHVLHIPTCRLSFRPAPFQPKGHGPKDPTVCVEIEEVALHRDLVQGFLNHIRPPTSADGSVAAKMVTTPHHDDDDEWVYSRCIPSEFTDMDRDQATFLSNNGMLCCWASVVLVPWPDQEMPGHAAWDINFVVHRVGLCTEHHESDSGDEDEDDDDEEEESEEGEDDAYSCPPSPGPGFVY
ncbi:hypothetical protein QBC43DRAFT_312157 [Cladorrhinum sp. PSN259]|nr:hypothetical protein QBC43DRAFT_312157 [Cladorrhinum sp. PSN259]